MIRYDLEDFLSTIPNNVTVVAATKYLGVDDMTVLLNKGVNHFGENRVDSFLAKYQVLEDDKNIVWHFIGHLQRNKALDVIDKIDYLDSLDSLELAKLINKSRTSPLKCLIEVSINQETNKNGVLVNDIDSFVEELIKMKNIALEGLMMMAIADSSKGSLIEQFSKLRELRDYLENKYNIKLPILSMGMSHDYKEAIECGATHIRLGRILFDR